MRKTIFGALLLIGAAPAQDRDWAATLRTDAQALHDDIAANHPGPVNPLDPGFSRRNDAALATALQRARQVRDYAGYRFALSAYAASFDDGHVGAYATKDVPTLSANWPGFLTGFNGKGKQVVMNRADDAAVPLGATLVSCDGRTADALSAANVGAFDGRWFLFSRRALRGGRLFIDQGNPFIRRPVTCTFDVEGKLHVVKLPWQPIAMDALLKRAADTNQHAHEPIGATVLPDGTRWFTVSGFDGDPNGPDAKALAPMIAAMRGDRDAIAKAPRIVLDLRGNSGGSSSWSQQIAQILWGEAVVAAIPDASYVEWRSSDAVLAAMQMYRERAETSSDATPRINPYYRKIVDGLTATRQAGKELWREPSNTDQPAPSNSTPVTSLSVPVYYITDTGCGSACLDAVDVWRALGAIGVGQVTSADTLYMDVRSATLPSGLTSVSVPMKVYRGRPRGSNVEVKPDYPYPGDMRDTAALAKWIASLPPHR